MEQIGTSVLTSPLGRGRLVLNTSRPHIFHIVLSTESVQFSSLLYLSRNFRISASLREHAHRAPAG